MSALCPHPRLAAAALVLAALAAPAARADHLDAKLLETGPQVIEYLHHRGYQNVGVLRFRLEQAGKPASFSAGALNGNLAERLENVLVMCDGSDEAQAVGIIHRAGEFAARAGRVNRWYADPADRAKLFRVDAYPLAWGSRKVKADAFLTGTVRLAADLARTTVVIEAFSAKDPAALDPVAEFTVDTDRSILRDAGANFAVARRSVVTKRSSDVDRFVLQKVGRRDGDSGADPAGGGAAPAGAVAAGGAGAAGGAADPTTVSPDGVGGVQFRMLSDGQPGPAPKMGADGKWTVECPDESRPVAFALKNTTDKKLGVVLKLNGVSTIDEQKDDAENCRKYVLKPGQDLKVEGFLMLGGAPANGKQQMTVAKFKILVGEEARAKKEELGDKAGEIAVDVFESLEAPQGDVAVSTRGTRPSEEKAARQSLAKLQRALMQSSHATKTVVAGREVIVADKQNAGPAGNVNVEDFPNPSRLAGLSIWLTPRAVTGNGTPAGGGGQP